jgi:hypothetical protein
MKRAVRIILTLLIAGAFWSCDLGEGELTEGNLLDEERGSLELIVVGAIDTSKTLAPDIVMEIATYDIRGEGPDPGVDYFEVLGYTDGALTQHNLKPGPWTITVEARNADVPGDQNRNGTVIGYGETDPPVIVSASSVSTIVIDVAPLNGAGELDLTLRWDKKLVSSPSIVASLTPVGSTTPQTLTFDLIPQPPADPQRGTYNDPNIATGYYTLSMQLFGASGLVWGCVEAVRIIYGEATIFDYTVN